MWLVYELPPLPLEMLETASLIFENDYVIRRVRNFPSDWRTFSDEALFAMSWNA